MNDKTGKCVVCGSGLITKGMSIFLIEEDGQRKVRRICLSCCKKNIAEQEKVRKICLTLKTKENENGK